MSACSPTGVLDGAPMKTFNTSSKLLIFTLATTIVLFLSFAIWSGATHAQP